MLSRSNPSPMSLRKCNVSHIFRLVATSRAIAEPTATAVLNLDLGNGNDVDGDRIELYKVGN